MIKTMNLGLIAKFILVTMITIMGSTAAIAKDVKKEELGELIRAYLIENPEVVVEALDEYQKNQDEIEARLFKKRLGDNKAKILEGNAPFAGNPDGDVVVVEFFDYNCGYCKRAADDVSKILEDPNVKVIFKEMPILSPASKEAAKWALAAHNQGKYSEFHFELMSRSGQKNTGTYETISKKLELDLDKMRDDVKNDKDIEEAINTNLELSRTLGIRGTPAFIIGDELSPGYIGFDNLKKAVEKQREE